MLAPFLFLDIDGVLNGHEAHGNKYCGCDPRSVASLNSILSQTGASVVVASAWRYFVLRGEMTVAGFDGMMCTHGVLPRSIVSVLSGDRPDGLRGPLVLDWFRANYSVVSRCPFAVLDDMDLGYSDLFADRFFKTEPLVGLRGLDPAPIVAALRRR